MRALLPFVGLLSCALAAVRLWVAYRRPPAVRSARWQRLARIFDFYLLVLAVIAGFTVVVLLVGVIIDVLRNV